MRLQIKALHDHLDDSVKAYVEKRIGKLGKRLYDQTLVEVILAKEHNPSIANSHSAEAIVHTKGPNLVARVSATTYEAAIDELVEKLERQIERYRDKRKLNPRRDAQKKAAAGAPPVEEPVLEEPGKEDEAAA
ncbi:MAG: ribosome-associated translation inhibitor RaiA [Actinobacteria bacterium]|nr:ribosome-associated translation inhibitor RaiA [Actinomycetota bacterium]